jgi:hypothetical protein
VPIARGAYASHPRRRLFRRIPAGRIDIGKRAGECFGRGDPALPVQLGSYGRGDEGAPPPLLNVPVDLGKQRMRQDDMHTYHRVSHGLLHDGAPQLVGQECHICRICAACSARRRVIVRLALVKGKAYGCVWKR